MKLLGTELTRSIEQDMFDYLPKFYEEYRESRAILQAEASELEQLHIDIDDVLAQFYIDTATWGLALWWEPFVGIKPDETKPVDERRSVVKSKLRGVGTVTVELIKNVAESFANGEVEIVDDSANATVNVKFVGEMGVPPSLPDIQKALRDIIPAHLAINYQFTYASYDELRTNYATYTALATTGKTYDTILIE